ncbi:MAG: hypothetical protein IH577_03710 [Deltaproteobacteria bacterium]|nr:hypothetical protein [Deltaproteobacteria bacterium]
MRSERKNAGIILCGVSFLFLYAACGGGGGGGSSPPATLAPTVVTSTVNTPSIVTALVNGSVNPNGLGTTAWFEYGTDPSLGAFTKTADQVIAAGTVPQSINATLLSLDPGTIYYYRVAATNSAGTLKGAIVNLATTSPPPTVHTSTSDPAVGSAVVNGTVNPNGLATTAWFEYGNDSALTNPTRTDNQVIPAGLAGVPITATLPALNTATLYYYRVSAQSAGGLSNGVINSFTTTSTPPPIVDAGTDQTVMMGHPVTLDGSGSSDPYGTITAFEWTQLSGTAVTLSAPAAASTTFAAPTVSYPGENLAFQLKATDDRPVSGTDNVNVDVRWGFLDDFSTDTRGSYQVSLIGSQAAFTYDTVGKRARILSGNDNHVTFARSLPASDQGVFSLDFLPTVKYPTGGGIWIRLIQDSSNYYEIQNFNWDVPDDPHPNTASVRKVVGGSEVEKKLYTNSFAQGFTHTITIIFSPSLTTVVAFGETINLSANGTGITVSGFDVHTGQQDAYYDNIKLDAKP